MALPHQQNDALSRIVTHEEVCAIRYASIDRRLSSIEAGMEKYHSGVVKLLTGTIGALCVALATIVFKMLTEK